MESTMFDPYVENMDQIFLLPLASASVPLVTARSKKKKK